MRLLLDTHVAVWMVTDDERLSRAARDYLSADDTAGLVSVATIWEIAIKHSLGRATRDPMPLSGAQAWRDFEEAGLSLIDVEARHAAAIDLLPRLHGDPFDRLIVATALVEGMRLLTQDERLGDYGAQVIVV